MVVWFLAIILVDLALVAFFVLVVGALLSLFLGAVIAGVRGSLQAHDDA